MKPKTDFTKVDIMCIPEYQIRLIGGPKDGHAELVKFVESTLQYYTGPGRIAEYIETEKGKYVFDGYKQVLPIEAPEQKIQFYPEIEYLDEK